MPLLPASLTESLWVEFAALIESDRPEFCPTRNPVRAENRGTASDQGVQGQRTDLAVTVHSPRSMISACGLPTRVPDARPRAELAGAARPIRGSQGRRDPGA